MTAADDPILLDAERRRREKAELEKRRRDEAEGELGAADARGSGLNKTQIVTSRQPPGRARVRGPHVALTPNSDAHSASARSRPPKHDEPPVEIEPEAADDGYPRVREGTYRVALSGCAQRELWGRWRWLLTWTVVEGPAQGVELPQYIPRPKDSKARPRPGWAISAAYRIARGERLPRNLARLNPKAFLADAVFEARVRDVERDQFGAKVPEAARYSRVTNLERRLTGKGGSP